jgi:hypothetical protein
MVVAQGCEMKRKSLTYWRAQWLGNPVAEYPDLQALLKAILQRSPSISQTRIARADGSIVEVRNRNFEREEVSFLHCVTYKPGAEGTVVPKLAERAVEGPLATVSAPEDTDFLGEALMALVVGDHCLVCCDGMTVGQLRYYIQQMVTKLTLPNDCKRLELAAVANREKLEEIVRTGVREIGLSATLDELDQNTIDGVSVVERAKRGVLELVSSIFATDDNVQEIVEADLSNVNARLVVSFDSRRGGDVTQEQFDRAAYNITEENDHNFYIRLRSGGRIDAESMKLASKVELNELGSTVDHGDAWLKLEDFHSQLLALGYI